jgi:hypothetical protein
MKSTKRDTLFDIIDAADADGYATFTLSKQYVGYVFRDLPKNKNDALRHMLESLFYRQPLLTLKLERLKRWVTDIEASSTTDEAGSVHLRINLARMLLLPCERPATELAELRCFFAALLPFFEAHATERSDFQVCNNRTHNKAVYASFACRVQGKENMMEKDTVFQPALQAMVDASPTLQYFFRNVALALQKIGPWSWVCLDEDHLYGPNQGPWSMSFFAEHQAKSSEKSGT